ncbi:MAG TPA: hypothetical protein VMH89_12660, partial [Candidatus Acidoferrum sp.]|nr:hypothetical protein [Candidatus Acidoferrum sp.]
MTRKHKVLAMREVLLVVPLFLATTAFGQDAAAGASQLGKVYFPASCSAEAQPVLDKGLALLHSFQYMEAAQTFEAAEAR